MLAYPTFIWRLHWGMTPFDFYRDFRHQKTRVPGLSCGVICVIPRLAVSAEHRLVQTEGRTDWRTDTRSQLIPALASVARVKSSFGPSWLRIRRPANGPNVVESYHRATQLYDKRVNLSSPIPLWPASFWTRPDPSITRKIITPPDPIWPTHDHAKFQLSKYSINVLHI